MNYTKGGFPIWDDKFDQEHFSSEEIAESDKRVATITAIVQAKQEQGKSQQQLDHHNGEKEPPEL